MIINFKLKNIDDLSPWGTKDKLTMHWFALTEGDLWIKIADQNLYEYSSEAMEHFGNKPTPYNDYYIVRFIEDFTKLFETLSENIPIEIFQQTDNLAEFDNQSKKWLELNDLDEDEHSEFYFNEYHKLTSWRWDRTMDSGHLRGGPHISIFKCNNQIRISWETETEIENGVRLWTAIDGFSDTSLETFIKNVEDFGGKFFEKMHEQVKLAIQKDWGQIELDKQRLMEEHLERKAKFYENLNLLKSNSEIDTNWEEVSNLLTRMKREIKNEA